MAHKLLASDHCDFIHVKRNDHRSLGIGFTGGGGSIIFALGISEFFRILFQIFKLYLPSSILSDRTATTKKYMICIFEPHRILNCFTEKLLNMWQETMYSSTEL